MAESFRITYRHRRRRHTKAHQCISLCNSIGAMAGANDNEVKQAQNRIRKRNVRSCIHDESDRGCCFCCEAGRDSRRPSPSSAVHLRRLWFAPDAATAQRSRLCICLQLLPHVTARGGEGPACKASFCCGTFHAMTHTLINTSTTVAQVLRISPRCDRPIVSMNLPHRSKQNTVLRNTKPFVAV